MRIRILLGSAAAAAALFVTGCSVDTEHVADQISEDLEAQLGTAYEVSCPDDVDNEEGVTFTCTAEGEDGSSLTISAEVAEDDTVAWEVTGAEGLPE
jgi:hypothetical protein